MDILITHVIAWPTVLASLLMFGFAPGAVLRVIVLAYRRDNPRRAELLAELPNVPFFFRPLWVCEQLENALFEGLAGRLAALIGRTRYGRRRRSLPGQPSGDDAVARYLDLLEGFVAALWDFESRKRSFQAIPYRRVSPATSNRPLSGSTYWMTVDDHANLARGDRVELDGHPGLSAMVTDISGGGICVWFDTSVRHDTLPAQGSLRRSFDDRLYRMQMQAIAALREGNAVNPQLIRALADRTFLPLNPHSSAPLEISLAFDQYQLEAIRRASQVRDFLLVTSPPGTGRTRTTSEIVGQSVRKGERVLVVGATNIGVDSLLQRLRDEIVGASF